MLIRFTDDAFDEHIQSTTNNSQDEQSTGVINEENAEAQLKKVTGTDEAREVDQATIPTTNNKHPEDSGDDDKVETCQ